jgi:hypothetical protein
MTTSRTLPPAPTCRQTGSLRGSGACMAAWDGSCGYCGLPPVSVDMQAQLDALLDERAQLTVEGWR